MSSLIGLFRHATNAVTFEPGEKIFETGQTGDTMYAILEGEVEIIVQNKVVETAVTGGIIGEMALIDHSPRSADAIAKTPCRLVPVDQQRFLFMVSETPNFALWVMHIMAERLRAQHLQS